jgi:hypothetical protein
MDELLKKYGLSVMNDCYLASDIGGQLGSLVAARIPQRNLETSPGGLVILVAVLTLGQMIL